MSERWHEYLPDGSRDYDLEMQNARLHAITAARAVRVLCAMKPKDPRAIVMHPNGIPALARAVCEGALDIYDAEDQAYNLAATCGADYEETIRQMHTAIQRYQNEEVRVSVRIRRAIAPLFGIRATPEVIKAAAAQANPQNSLSETEVAEIIRDELKKYRDATC